MNTNTTALQSVEIHRRDIYTYKHSMTPIEPIEAQDPLRRWSRNIPWIQDRADRQLLIKQISHKSRMGILLLTCQGIDEFTHDDEAWTPNKDVEDREDNGQTSVPIPHSPCPYCEDHCWIPINATRNRNWKTNLLSDAASPKTNNSGSRRKVNSLTLHSNVRLVNFTNLNWHRIYSDTQSSSNSPPFDLEKK